MALDFPSSPALNDTYTDSGKTWLWNGSGWQLVTTGTVTNADISATAEIAVSKLADGAARQLLQTDAAGTGVEWTSNVDVPGTLDVTGAAVFDSTVAVTGALTKSGSNVVTVGDTGTVTSTMILDGTIVNADINASAAIADTKLATISTADKISISALNIDGGTDIGAALVDADLFIVDDGGGGTNRKAAATRITDYAFGKVSGDVTINSSGTAAIGSGVVVDADVNASAAIAGTKISPDFGSQTVKTTGTIELGHATDTTLSRSAAGVLAVEGVVVPTISSTNTLTNKTLTDPAIIGTILEDVYTISDGAAFEVDPGNGSIQLITLGANRTPKATNFAAGESVTLMVADGTAYTLTWTDATWGASGVVWVGGSAPTLETSGYTVIQFWKVSSTVYGARVGDVA